jgi:hypothetical protein
MRVSTMNAAVAATILTFAIYVDAFWRMECRASSGLALIDPLVNPGKIGSHVHSIFGSDGK